MTVSLSSNQIQNTQNVQNQTVQNAANTQTAQNVQVKCIAVPPKKSKAPKIFGSIGAGVGLAYGVLCSKIFQDIGMLEAFSKSTKLGIKCGISSLFTIGGVLLGLVFGGLVSLFTRNKRQQAAADEYNSKLNVNG